MDGPATPILGMDFFMKNRVVLDFTNTVVWSKELVNGIQMTGEPVGPRVEAADDCVLPPRCESAIVGNAPNLPPGSTILVEGSMDDLVSGIGVANTLTVVDGKGQCNVWVMNPHTQTISIPKGTHIGVTTIPKGIENPFPVASAPIATQCGQFRATVNALRIGFNIESDWQTSSDEEGGKIPTPEDLEKAWGVKYHHIWSKCTMYLPQTSSKACTGQNAV